MAEPTKAQHDSIGSIGEAVHTITQELALLGDEDTLRVLVYLLPRMTSEEIQMLIQDVTHESQRLEHTEKLLSWIVALHTDLGELRQALTYSVVDAAAILVELLKSRTEDHQRLFSQLLFAIGVDDVKAKAVLQMIVTTLQDQPNKNVSKPN